MRLFVDGFQNTGKSTLLDNLGIKHSRFPFNQYMDEIGIEDINGFQLGKDLGILFALLVAGNDEDIVFDRGPFSTVFYSLKEARYGEKTEETMRAFLRVVAEFPDCRYVFLLKKNEHLGERRVHEDGFDYLDDDGDPKKNKTLKKMKQMAEEEGIKLMLFENDFAFSPKENAERFRSAMRSFFE